MTLSARGSARPNKPLETKELVAGVVQRPFCGGYGNPLKRDPELVRSDVLDGFTTLELAERSYGVVIDHETMVVDAEATQRRERSASSS